MSFILPIAYDPNSDFVYDNQLPREIKPVLPPIVDTNITLERKSLCVPENTEHGVVKQNTFGEICVDKDKEAKHSGWKPDEVPINRRNFKYEPCQPNLYLNRLKYSTTEYPNLSNQSGFSLTDKSDAIYFLSRAEQNEKDAALNTDVADLNKEIWQNDVCIALKEEGWRTARSTSCIKEGCVYWEIDVVNADPQNGTNIRFGISRREASLEAPVGYDHYAYGLRDKTMQSVFGGKVHSVLPKRCLQTGDTVGILIQLPSYEEQVQQAKKYKEHSIALIEKSLNEKSLNSKSNKTKKSWKNNNTRQMHEEFEKSLLQECDPENVTRDQIAIRYKSMLLFESTDYAKEDVSLKEHQQKNHKQTKSKRLFHNLDSGTGQTTHTSDGTDDSQAANFTQLKDSCMEVYLNGEYLGKAFAGFQPVLPPFSQLNYNDKFYYNFWKTGQVLRDEGDKNEEIQGLMDQQVIPYSARSEANQLEGRETDALFSQAAAHDVNQSGVERTETYAGISSKPKQAGSILKNKYSNNNRLGYYPTVSCFNEGAAKIVTSRENLKYYDKVISKTNALQTLDDVFTKQVADDVVWDIIDEVEAEILCGTC
ncbi:hypothetical protein ACO0QE_000531 [Hanseniaspora vineae]